MNQKHKDTLGIIKKKDYDPMRGILVNSLQELNFDQNVNKIK